MCLVWLLYWLAIEEILNPMCDTKQKVVRKLELNLCW
uniref:Uncharacterized protein n=1 Tax=Arundo donax TaxID=35708 RepID=A0A0A9FH71_ARUDO